MGHPPLIALTGPATTGHLRPRRASLSRGSEADTPFAHPLPGRRIPLSGVVRDISPVRLITGPAHAHGRECDADPCPPTVR
ncbi:hypothetical protein SGPA1_60278 [Streptomyces misionensis JCM 4497]